MKVMKSLTYPTLRETRYDDEQDLLRMNDEGCPNDPLLDLPNKTGIEGVCETLGQMLHHPEFLGSGVAVPQPLLDLVWAVRNRLAVKVDEKLNLEDEGDLISSIIGYRC
jgi:hypothetical protein